MFSSFVLYQAHRAHIWYDQLKQVNWFPVKQRVEQIKLCHFHNIVKTSAYLCKPQPVSNPLNTRHITSSLIPKYITFEYTVVQLWNSLPVNIKEIDKRLAFSEKKSGLSCLAIWK